MLPQDEKLREFAIKIVDYTDDQLRELSEMIDSKKYQDKYSIIMKEIQNRDVVKEYGSSYGRRYLSLEQFRLISIVFGLGLALIMAAIYYLKEKSLIG